MKEFILLGTLMAMLVLVPVAMAAIFVRIRRLPTIAKWKTNGSIRPQERHSQLLR